MEYKDELLRRILRWDEAAFHVLYKEYYKALTGYAMHLTDSPETAEDIVQDIFSRLYERKDQFDSMRSLRTFLYNSTRNASLDYIRHRSAEQKYYHHQQKDENEAISDYDFENEERYRQLFKLIDDLPQRQREILLECLRGRRIKEIAVLLQVSTETVKTQKQRGIKKIKEKLSPILIIVTFL